MFGFGKNYDESSAWRHLSFLGGFVILSIFLLFVIPNAAKSQTTTLPFVSSTTGDLSVTGQVFKLSGSFAIDHPLDPDNKLLFHSFLESPDVKNIYDGVATLDKDGETVIELPSYFEALNRDYRYLATPIGTPAPNLYLKKAQKKNKFIIAGGEPGQRVSWQITGIRKDPYILANPIVPEVEKGPNQITDKGEYRFKEFYEPDD